MTFCIGALQDHVRSLAKTYYDPNPLPGRPAHNWAMFDAALGNPTGTAERLLQRRKGGILTEEEADELACTFRAHPGTIWPEWYDEYEEAAA